MDMLINEGAAADAAVAFCTAAAQGQTQYVRDLLATGIQHCFTYTWTDNQQKQSPLKGKGGSGIDYFFQRYRL